MHQHLFLWFSKFISSQSNLHQYKYSNEHLKTKNVTQKLFQLN